MISIQVSISIKEAAGQRKERETESRWQSPVEITNSLRYAIWKPTREGDFLSVPGNPNRQEEGVFIYPNPAKYRELGGKSTVVVVSCGKAEVFIRQGENEMCLIRRGSLRTVTPEIMVVPDEGLGFEKQALIIFQELGKPADIFLRVNGKFTAEARIECQESNSTPG